MAGLGRPGPGPRSAMPAWKREILERKRAKLASLGSGAAESAGPPERRVLAESLGPLRENPFLRLEPERRRGARPVQQLLELYRHVPGVRTIRADNILIIESATDFAPAAGAAHIRAAEVLVCEAPPPPGRVSRLLEKFDPPAAPRRHGSTERARPPPPPPPPPGPCAPPGPRVGERAARFEPGRLRGCGAGSGPRSSNFVQKTGSNSFTVHPRGLHRGAASRPPSNVPAAPEPRASPANGLAGSPNGLGEWKPKVESGETSLHSPPSPGAPSAIPTASSAFSTLSPSSATPSQRRWVSAATSANDSFEIRPAPKPDVETIPPGDLQARALASLRAHSRNSFVFIPKRKVSGSPPPQGRQSVQLQEGEVGQAFQSPKQGGQLVPEADGLPALGRSPLVEVQWAAEERDCPRPSPALADPAVGWQRPASPPACMLAAAAEPAQGSGAPSLVRNGPELARPGLPITFIDEVASEEQVSQEAKLPDSGIHTPPRYCRQPAGPGHAAGLQQQGSNTFTVVPRRKLGVLQEQYSGQANGEPQPQVTEEEGPCATLVTAPKKRYPTVHEIEVIGGYLALRKSCLTKASSSRKKMKISFNDKSLQTTFEYPSESSLVQEEEAKATEETEEETEEEEESELGSEKPFALFLPRATFVGSVGSESPRLPGGSSGLSSYTPKHTMAFSKWQEQTLEQAQSEAESPPQEVMLTPASRNDRSDFCSEPALHF